MCANAVISAIEDYQIAANTVLTRKQLDGILHTYWEYAFPLST